MRCERTGDLLKNVRIPTRHAVFELIWALVFGVMPVSIREKIAEAGIPIALGLAFLIPVSIWGQQTNPQMHVWAVGDSFRIDATTGRAFEVNSLVFPDAPGGNYRETSLLWDSARKRISIKAARNEIVSFQVIVERTAASPLTGVDVKVGDLA